MSRFGGSWETMLRLFPAKRIQNSLVINEISRHYSATCYIISLLLIGCIEWLKVENQTNILFFKIHKKKKIMPLYSQEYSGGFNAYGILYQSTKGVESCGRFGFYLCFLLYRYSPHCSQLLRFFVGKQWKIIIMYFKVCNG